jgi:hypothetical protein
LGLLFLILAKLFKFRFNAHVESQKVSMEIVYVVADKDLQVLPISIASLHHITGIDITRIVLIARPGGSVEDFARDCNLVFVNENDILGFGTDKYVYPYSSGARSGWLYQQMLKFGWSFKTQAQSYIVVDSDTVFVNDVSFFSAGKYHFFASTEWNPPYSLAYEKLLGEKDESLWSYTAHMMIFDVYAVKVLLSSIGIRQGGSWHNAIANMRSVDPHSCFSEYHTYASWFIKHNPKKSYIIPLYNKSLSPTEYLSQVNANSMRNLSTFSMHSYLRASR